MNLISSPLNVKFNCRKTRRTQRRNEEFLAALHLKINNAFDVPSRPSCLRICFCYAKELRWRERCQREVHYRPDPDVMRRPSPKRTWRRRWNGSEKPPSAAPTVICLPELFQTQYFCQREDTALFDLAESDSRACDEAPRRSGAGAGRGGRRFPVRAARRGHLPQHGGHPRRDGNARGHLPQDAHPRRSALLREVLLHARRSGLQGVRHERSARSARWCAGTSGIPRARA